MRMTSLLTLAAAALMATQALADPITLRNTDDLAWKTSPEGVAFAALKGDRFKEPYHAMVRLPAGTVSPLHTKSATMFGVMIEGRMIHHVEGEPPANADPVGPGGFYVIPAGLPHVSACVSAEACLTYLYQDGPFDFLPVPQ